MAIAPGRYASLIAAALSLGTTSNDDQHQFPDNDQLTSSRNPLHGIVLPPFAESVFFLLQGKDAVSCVTHPGTWIVEGFRTVMHLPDKPKADLSLKPKNWQHVAQRTPTEEWIVGGPDPSLEVVPSRTKAQSTSAEERKTGKCRSLPHFSATPYPETLKVFLGGHHIAMSTVSRHGDLRVIDLRADSVGVVRSFTNGCRYGYDPSVVFEVCINPWSGVIFAQKLFRGDHSLNALGQENRPVFEYMLDARPPGPMKAPHPDMKISKPWSSKVYLVPAGIPTDSPSQRSHRVAVKGPSTPL